MSSLPSPNQSNHPPIWFLLLLGLGGPIAVGLTIAQSITKHVWQALGITLIYFVIVLVGGIVAKVWQQLENNWVKQIVDWINTRSQKYERSYCQWFIAQHSQFDIGGLRTYETPLPTFKQIFVELNLARKSPFQISSATFKASEAPAASQHPISYYLEQAHLVVLGLPGSGKTTLLKNLGLTLVSRKKQRKASRIPYKLPFFLSLRDYANTISDQVPFSLVDAIQTPLQKWNRPAPSGWVEGHLTKGNCLILLDGLDEVPDEETRLAMAKWVQQQIVAFGHNNRFILTSRPYGYLYNPLNGVLVLEVQGFTNEQIRKFVYKWYEAEGANRSRHSLGSSEYVKHEAEGFLWRLYNTSTLFDLARNPLLLTMSIMVHRYRGALPGSRGELYKEICDVFLGGRQRAKGLRLALSPEQNQLVLRPLAFYMMEKQKTELTPSEAELIIKQPLKTVSTEMQPQAFLKIIEDSNFWVKQGHDVYGFAHLSFQEYLAAMHVKEKNLKQVLVDQIESSWWREAIILYCNRADASPIIKACLTGRALTVPILQLALECEEAASRSSSIDDPFVRVLFDSVLIQGAEDANPEIRQIVAEARLAQRIKKMIPLDDEVYSTTSLINCIEYQLFLDEQEKGKYYHPDHWMNKRFPAGHGQASVLGVRPSDALAFCIWLTERDQENWRYRLPHASEVKQVEESMNEEGKVVIGTGYWINNGKGFAWVRGNPVISTEMIQETMDRSCASDLQQALTYSPNLENEGERELAKSLSGARDLAEISSLTSQLVVILNSVRDRIRAQDRSLAAKLADAKKNVNQLENKLKEVETQEQTMVNRLASKEREITRLEGRRSFLDSQESKIKKDLAQADKQDHTLKSKPTRSKTGQHVRSNPQNMHLDKSALQVNLKDVINEKNALDTQLERAQEEALTQRQALQSFRAQKADQQIKIELERARKYRQAQQTEMENFRTRTDPFASECDRLLAITPLYNRDVLFLRALSRNRTLDLDRVLVNINDPTLGESLASISNCASTFTQDLTSAYDHNRSIISAYTNDLTESDKVTLTLKQLLNKAAFTETTQRLANTFWFYLGTLSKRRPIGRSTPAGTLMRFAIRYLAKALADYFAYWSWKELCREEEQANSMDQQVIDTLLDIYVIFAMLEERVKGQLPACEGILIVKERLEENQEKSESRNSL